MVDNIASQARYYNNISIIKRNIRSVVHLENEEDKAFWDSILQQFRPGGYLFVSYSKSERGNETSGCDQCRKFIPYLSPGFFICIDSDLRYLLGEPEENAAHFVVQTYTYSWENHYCQCDTLQSSVSDNTKGFGFDFKEFLSNFSAVLYEPLLLLLYCMRTGKSLLSERMFRRGLIEQCLADDLQENGEGYIRKISQYFANYLAVSSSVGFDLNTEAAIYEAKGLTKENTYLHVRGHNLYDLVVYVGKMFSRPLRISFEADVLKKATIGGDYWEYKRIGQDLESF